MQQNSRKNNFDSIMRFLSKNKVLSDAQSGFRPSDSCDYQLLSIIHDIYKSLYCGPPLEVWRIFLDISKAFDRVWHDGLIYKIKSFGGFSWGSVLGSLLFLMYVNDLSCRLSSTTKRFADDTSLFSVVHDVSNLPMN